MNVELFVYGLLAPGEPAWPLLAPYAIDTNDAGVPGTLYDTGRGYPAAVFTRDSIDAVRGWRCTLVDPPLAELDEFEGGEYERITVRCTDGTEALAYQWIAPLDGFVAVTDGSWATPR